MTEFNILGKGRSEHTFDAIVIGSGITGGIAAKELSEGGLKVLLLERGHMVEHIRMCNYATLLDYTANLQGLVSIEKAGPFTCLVAIAGNRVDRLYSADSLKK